MSSRVSGSSSSRLRFINKKCDCGRRAAIRCSESKDHKNWLYYNCQDRVCKFFEWAEPVEGHEDNMVGMESRTSHDMEPAMTVEENLYLRAEVMMMKQRVDTMGRGFSLLGYAVLMLYFLVTFVFVVSHLSGK